MTEKKNGCKTDKIGNIVLPEQAGLRDAYLAALRLTLSEGRNDHWLGTLINIISSDCGVNRDTAKNRCKQLSRFGLFNFISSSVLGHKFRVMVFKKNGDDISIVEDWRELDRLLSEAIPGSIESDLIKVHRIMKRGITERTSRNAVEEVKHVFNNYNTGKVIEPGSDTIQSKVEFKEKMTTLEVCRRAEKQLINEKRAEDEHQNRDAPGNEVPG